MRDVGLTQLDLRRAEARGLKRGEKIGLLTTKFWIEAKKKDIIQLIEKRVCEL